MATTGVRVTRADDTTKTYPAGRSFDFDGYGDLVIRDQSGDPVATRRRGSWVEIELVHDTDPVEADDTPA